MEKIQIAFETQGTDTAGKAILDLGAQVSLYVTRVKEAAEASKSLGTSASTTLTAALQKVAAPAAAAAADIERVAVSAASLKKVLQDPGASANFINKYKEDVANFAGEVTKTNNEVKASVDNARNWRAALDLTGISYNELRSTMESVRKEQTAMDASATKVAKIQAAMYTASGEEAGKLQAKLERANGTLQKHAEAFYSAKGGAEAYMATISTAMQDNKGLSGISKMADSLKPMNTRLEEMRSQLTLVQNGAMQAKAELSKLSPTGATSSAYASKNTTYLGFASEAKELEVQISKLQALQARTVANFVSPTSLSVSGPLGNVEQQVENTKLYEAEIRRLSAELGVLNQRSQEYADTKARLQVTQDAYVTSLRGESYTGATVSPDQTILGTKQGTYQGPLTAVDQRAEITSRYTAKIREQEAALAALDARSRAHDQVQAELNATKAAYAKELNTVNAALNKETAAENAAASAAKRSTSSTTRTGSGLTGRLAPTENAMVTNLTRLGMVSPQIGQLGSVLSLVSSSGLAAGLGIVAVGAAVAALGKASLTAAVEIQKYDITLQALSTHGWDAADKSITGSRDLGKAVAESMLSYAETSIYAFDKIASGTEKLVGYGVDMRVVNGEMAMLGNLALGDSKRLENLSVAYGQVFGQGKARAQEMYQFVNAGIPIFDALATKMGISTKAVMDMTRNGEIDFKIVREVLKDLTAEGGRYHDLMQQIAGLSVSGQWTQFQNELKITFKDIGTTMIPLVTDMLRQVNTTLARMHEDGKISDIKSTLQATRYMSPEAKKTALNKYGSPDIYMLEDKLNQVDTWTKKYGAPQYVPKSYTIEEQLYSQFRNSATSSLQTYGNTSALAPKARTDILKGGMNASIQAMQSAGVSDKDIIRELLATLYKGIKLEAGDAPGTMSIDAFMSKYSPSVSSGQLQKNFDSLDKQKQYTAPGNIRDAVAYGIGGREQDLSNIAGEFTPEQQLAIRAEAEMRRKREKEGEDSLYANAGSGETDTGAKRKFLLDEYIKKLSDEQNQLTELVPLYAEYIRISNMGADDAKAKESGKKTQLGMDQEQIKLKEELARKLYAENTALGLIRDTYADIYKYADGQKAPLRAAETHTAVQALHDKFEEQRTTDLSKAGKKGSAAYTAITERQNPYENTDAIEKLITSSSDAGTTPAEAASKLRQIAEQVNGPQHKTATSFTVALQNYAELIRLYNSADALSARTIDILLKLRDAHGDAYAEDILARIAAYNKLAAGETSEIERLQAAYDGLTDSRAKELALRDIRGAKRKNSGGASDLDELYADGIYDRDTRLPGEFTSITADNGSLAGRGLSGSLGTAMSGMIYGGELRDASANKDSAQSDFNKAQANYKADANPFNLDAYEKADKKLQAMDQHLQKVSKSALVVKDAFDSFKKVAISATLDAANDSMYQLGSNMAKGKDAAEGMSEIWVSWSNTIRNAIPSILLAAAQAVMPKDWKLGVGLLVASGLVSGINGMSGTKDSDSSAEDARLQALSNLKDQFKIMIEQLEANVLYLDAARTKYISDTQLATVAGYAMGDVFSGSTGLRSDVYTQPTMFRFANGGAFSGVLGEAGPESVMPLKRGADGKLGVTATGAAAGVNVVINNNAAAEVSVTEEQGPNGQKQLTVVMEKLLTGMIGKGKIDSALQSRYRLRPAGFHVS